MVTNRVVFLTGAASGIGYEMGNTLQKKAQKLLLLIALKIVRKKLLSNYKKKAFKLSVYNVTLHLKKKLQ